MRKRLLYALVLIVLASLFCFSFTACKDDENPDNGKSCSHTYSDTYTCHDRRCTLCNEVLSATTNHDFTYGDCPCSELNTCQHCSKLTSIYYKGSADDWANNIYLTKATRYYYIENEVDVPTDGGNYWHYVDGVPTAW